MVELRKRGQWKKWDLLSKDIAKTGGKSGGGSSMLTYVEGSLKQTLRKERRKVEEKFQIVSRNGIGRPGVELARFSGAYGAFSRILGYRVGIPWNRV